ncbi:MAG: DmsC/YnfH family molybdoenzyme membrane anchor subunit [Pirellulales bacterium]
MSTFTTARVSTKREEGDTPSLLETLLREQHDLTAVQRFSQWHETESAPVQEQYYKELIPLTLPVVGEQYAFSVDLDACSGCKACVTACHSLNGLEEDEIWREVGMLTGGSEQLPVLQHITSACHHCVEPGCLQGCPVKAYDKDPVTGIVRHLDDQCMGCQYCILMCPYEVPKYSVSKGIVRKCDMCRQRLAEGEAPACVQSCPNQAIRIEIVTHDEVRTASRREEFLPHAPTPQITFPTTRYFSRRESMLVDVEKLVRGDRGCDTPAHAHWPLIGMLTLTQLSVGVLFVERLLSLVGGATGSVDLGAWGSYSTSFVLLVLASVASAIGGGAATLHLGRPIAAIRAWLGLRTSWLSREIVAFGVYGGLIVGAAMAVSPWKAWLPEIVAGPLPWIAALVGAIGVYSSAQLYAVTQRSFWELGRTLGKFALTAALLGVSAALLVTGTSGIGALVLVLAIAKLAWEREIVYAARQEYSLGHRYLSRTVELMRGPLAAVVQARTLLLLVGGVMLPLLVLLLGYSPKQEEAGVKLLAMGLSLGILFAGEVAERYLFFAAVISPRMPGAPTHGHA